MKKLIFRTFMCPEKKERSSGMVTLPCPECVEIARVKALVETRKAEYKAAGRSDADIKALLEGQSKWLNDHNLEKKFSVNVKTLEGKFGVLRLTTRLKNELVNLMKDLLERRKEEPTNPRGGFWFCIKRTGNGTDQQNPDKLYVKMDIVEIPVAGVMTKVEIPAKAPLSAQDVVTAVKCCDDIGLPPSTVLTASQVQELVSSNGEPELVDAVFNSAVKTEKAPEVSPRTAQSSPQPKSEAGEPARPVVADTAVEVGAQAAAQLEEAQRKAKEAADRRMVRMKQPPAEVKGGYGFVHLSNEKDPATYTEPEMEAFTDDQFMEYHAWVSRKR